MMKCFISFPILSTYVTLLCSIVDAKPVTLDNLDLLTEEAVSYLEEFNYISSANTSRHDPIFGDTVEDGGVLSQKNDIRNGISTFQRMWGLNVTGQLTNETLHLMQMPRCGLPDVMEDNLRRKRYLLTRGTIWSEKKLRYKFINYTPDLPQSVIISVFKRAFQVWSDHIPLDFIHVSTDSAAEIEISFASGKHCLDKAFDGARVGRNVLAHAFFPDNLHYAGDIHFDEDETWTDGSYTGTNLLYAAAHEIGHSLGMDHTTDIREALMAPIHRGYIQDLQLHEDDIRGIQVLYGQRQKTTTDRVETTTTRVPPQLQSTKPRDPSQSKIGSPNVPSQYFLSSVCTNTQFDALTEMDDGKLYAFKGNSYYQITANGFAQGYPKLISTGFLGLPNNLSAAVFFSSQGNGKSRTYFFKGDTYYRVESFKVVSSGLISKGFYGLPNDIDAAFSRVANGDIYFIKGNDYYRYIRGQGVSSGYPRSLSRKIDNAFEWGKENYFTNGKNYYHYNDSDAQVDDSYPLDFGRLWFNCDVNTEAELHGTKYRSAGAAAELSSIAPYLLVILELLLSLSNLL